MPKHCYFQVTNAPTAQSIDFSVKWNWNNTAYTNSYAVAAKTQTLYNSLVCNVGTYAYTNVSYMAYFTYEGNDATTVTTYVN